MALGDDILGRIGYRGSDPYRVLQAVETLAYTNRTTNARRRLILQELQDRLHLKNTISAFAVFSVRDIMGELLLRVPEEIQKEIRVFADLTNGSITRNREGRLKRLHEEAAQDALRHIKHAYEHRNPRRNMTPYRINETGKNGEPVRYSGGRLEKALTSPEMYRVARDGLDFIDPLFLDRAARQWYRLNFGAGERGQETRKPPRQRMVMFGQSVGDFALNNFGPSRGFVLPAGFWTNRAGSEIFPFNRDRNQDRFYPLRTSGRALLDEIAEKQRRARRLKAAGPSGMRELQQTNLYFYLERNRFDPRHIKTTKTLTVGIKGSRFLDAGVNRLAKTLPFFYTELYNEWFDEYTETGGGPVASEKVRGSTRTVNRAHQMAKAEMAKLASQRRLRAVRQGGRFRR